jgi:hypothetical protein
MSFPREWLPVQAAMRLTSAAVIAVSILAMSTLAAGPAQALTDQEAEKLYTDYHRAIRVYELCKNVEFGTEEHLALGDEIAERIEHRIGAKRLKLLTAGQRDAREMVDDLGCDHYDVRYYVRLFLTDLKPALE